MRATRWLAGVLGAGLLAAPAAAQDWGYLGINGAWTSIDGAPVLDLGRVDSSELKLSGPSFEFRGFNGEFTFGFRNAYMTAKDVLYRPEEAPFPVPGKLTRFSLPFTLELGPSLSLQRLLTMGGVRLALPPALFDVRVFATAGFGLGVLNFVDPEDEYGDDFNLVASVPIRFGLQVRFWFLAAHVMYTKELWVGSVADELEGWPSTFEIGGGFAFGFGGGGNEGSSPGPHGRK